ncbi:MAG: CPBP family intramembrane metalloprotease, partial [Prevotella sp.]|nr:CPBP family intramembrane metalloprotease [Prevotella sp.]
SLWFPIGIHWAWNFTQGNVFGFAVSGRDIEESILTATLSGPDIITGGSFGLEASIISLILGTILSAFYLWKILKSQHL